MRDRGSFWRIYATYLLVIVVLCTAAIGFYAVRSVRDFYVDHTETGVAGAGGAGARAGPPAATRSDTPAELEALVHAPGRGVGDAHHLIAADRAGAQPIGDVLADSDSDPPEMESHATRPEFLEALAAQPAPRIRYSMTLRQDMMYVAVPSRRTAGSRRSCARPSRSPA